MADNIISGLKKAGIIVGGTFGGAILAAVVYNYFTCDPRNAEDNMGRGVFIPGDVMETSSLGVTETGPVRFAKHAPKLDSVPVLILYGTEYGLSRELAKKMEEEILQLGGKLYPRVVDMEDHSVIEWEKEQTVLLICSTYGDGVPPTRARGFFDWMQGSKESMGHIQFSVLALGDCSYPHFARAGKTMDSHFENMGGKRFHATSHVDLEDWTVIDKWFAGTLNKLVNLELEVKQDYLWDKAESYQKKTGFNRQNPFYAKLIKREGLTVLDGAEDKETIHFELDLEESGLEYIVGDSLGVLPVNRPEDVDRVLKGLAGLNKTIKESTLVKLPAWAHQVPAVTASPSIPLRQALTYFYDLKNLKVKTLQALLKEGESKASSAQLEKLKQLLKDGAGKENTRVVEYFEGRELVDVLEDFSSFNCKLETVLDTLPQLQPRYYSISSSFKKNPKLVTITVAVVRYSTHNKDRVGVCSTFLNDRVQVGDRIPIFVNNNPDFRLPSEKSTPILMVGPGTGIAPFRAMLQDRVIDNATGSNVLYFGCRKSDQDYLYKTELAEYVSQGQLTLHTAFSRETSQKVYVQHRIKEQGEAIWALLQSGGHVYICGDAKYMAVDVHSALKDIVTQYGSMDHQAAEKFLHDLETSNKYQKDIWF
jgi:sulfite reductase (NADPH) flavoprotein alpha-component